MREIKIHFSVWLAPATDHPRTTKNEMNILDKPISLNVNL